MRKAFLLSGVFSLVLSVFSAQELTFDFETPVKGGTDFSVITKGKPEYVSGIKGKAVKFNSGADGLYLIVKKGKNLGFKADESFTIEYYFKAENNRESKKQWHYSAAFGGIRFAHRAIQGSPFCFINYKKRLWTKGAGIAEYTDGNWHHLAFVRNAQQKIIYLYCDGKKLHEAAETAEMTNAFADIRNFSIGAGGFGIEANFKGCIDEFKVIPQAVNKFNLIKQQIADVIKAPVDKNVEKSWDLIKKEKLNLFPAPKELKLIGKIPFVPADWKIDRREASDLAGYQMFLKRLEKLSLPAPGKGGKVIVADFYDKLIKEFPELKKISKPKREGYVIIGNDKRIILAGTDRNGLRYAWLTLAQLVDENKNIRLAEVRDYPDFRYRNFQAGQLLTEREIDDAFICRTNLMGFRSARMSPNIEKIMTPAYIKKMSRYAADRGIELSTGFYTQVGILENWQKHVPSGYGPHYYPYKTEEGLHCYYQFIFSWCRDDLAQKQGDFVGRFMQERGAVQTGFHAEDYGGVENPGNWKNRTPRDRARWGNDRVAAEANLIRIFADNLRKHVPGARVRYTQYPYISTDDPEILKYYREISKALGTDIQFHLREAEREKMLLSAKQFGKSPVHVSYYPYDYSFCPSFVNTARYVPTLYLGENSSITVVNWNMIGSEASPSNWASCEYFWNANAPGGEYLPADHYKYHRVFAESRKIEEELLPRICSIFYGEKAGKLVAEAFAFKFSDRIPEHPEQILPAEINREEFMFKMAADAETALELVSKAEKVATKEGKNRLKNHKKYLQSCVLLAKARAHAVKARRMLDEGKNDEAVAEAEKGKALLKDKKARFRGRQKAILPDLDIAEAVALRGKQNEYIKNFKSKPIRIAFYKYAGNGDGGGRIANLPADYNGRLGISTSTITNLTKFNLQNVDVLIFNANAQLGDCEENAVENIKEFVKSGKGVIFCHNAVGRYKSAFSPSMFPEVCSGYAERVVNQELTVVDDSIFEKFLKKGDVYYHRYTDHCALASPGKNGKVMLKNFRGMPTLIVGSSGKGRVVYTAEIFGGKAQGKAKSDLGDWQMLLQLIRWAGKAN